MDQSAYPTFIIHVITNNTVMWKTLQNNADWDCLKTLTLREILRIRIPHQVEHCAFSEAIRLFPISWMCKKQTSVSRSSTEAEIISLDAGLRMDGTPALDFWDLIVTVFHGNTHQNDQVWWDPKMTSLSSMVMWSLTPPQNRTFSKITFIVEQNE